MDTSTEANGPFFFRFYLYVANPPTSSNSIFKAAGNIYGEEVEITLDQNSQLQLTESGSPIGSPSSALSPNTWYYVEIEAENT